MQTATTLEFRTVMREVASARKLEIGNTWTNGGNRRSKNTARTVGARCNFDATNLVDVIEGELAKIGRTARTRVTFSPFSMYRYCYLRGTCVIDK